MSQNTCRHKVPWVRASRKTNQPEDSLNINTECVRACSAVCDCDPMDWTSITGRQKISYNPSCKKDQHIKWEKKMVIEMRPMPLGGNYEKGMVPSPWEPPSSSEKSAGTDRELQKLRGEYTSRLVSDRAEKGQHRWSLSTCYTSEPKSCPCWCVQW